MAEHIYLAQFADKKAVQSRGSLSRKNKDYIDRYHPYKTRLSLAKETGKSLMLVDIYLNNRGYSCPPIDLPVPSFDGLFDAADFTSF